MVLGAHGSIYIYIYSGQITIIPKPEFFGHFGDTSLTKPPFGVTSAEVAIICPDIYIYPYLDVPGS